jgi:hypothetical protein
LFSVNKLQGEMSTVRVLKIRRSTAAEPESPPPPAAAVKTGPLPLEPPYDRQSIMRFPSDIAAKVREILNDKGTTDLTEVIRITVESDQINGHEFRLYSVQVFEHQRHLKPLDMKGVLVDLPTFVESYKTVNSGVTLTKSADISQMMICFKLSEFSLSAPSDEVRKALNLLYASGITPPTSRIRYRKFRPPPTKEDVQNLRSAEDLVESVMTGGALEWVVETEVDEEEAVQRSINEPENVWTPTEEILAQLRQAGYLDEFGDVVHTDEEDEEMHGFPALSM